MTPVELIQKKRDGGELSRDDIRELVSLYLEGKLAAYQMSAMLMAMFLRGMTDAETVALMDTMLHTGEVPLPEGFAGPRSTSAHGRCRRQGFVCSAPLVASCGVFVPWCRTRARAHQRNGRQAQAIPGFRTDLDARTICSRGGNVGLPHRPTRKSR
jgi:thymidine phosphorylase